MLDGGIRTDWRRCAWAATLATWLSFPVLASSQSAPPLPGPSLQDGLVPPTLPLEPVEPEPEFAAPTTLDRVGRVVAPVEIDGRGPFRFILDTGANRSAISQRTAQRLLLPLDLDAAVSVHGMTGTAVMPTTLVRTLRAGDLVFENQRLPVLPDGVFADVDGILGIDCLQEARVEIDFARDRVTIRRSPSRRAAAGRLVVPADLRHGGLLLVQGRVGRVRVKAILDTGAERSLGNEALRAALAAQKREPDTLFVHTVMGATPQLALGTAFVAPAIDLGGARLTNLTVTFGDLHVFNVWSLLGEPALVIGMDLLGTLENFSVDYPRREFHLKTREAPGGRSRACNDTDCRLWMSGG